MYTDPVAGTPCRFRTCYPVTLWPLEIASAGFETPRGRRAVARRGHGAAARPALHRGAKLEELQMDRLRFYLFGEGPLVYKLYEALFGTAFRVHLRAASGDGDAVELPASCLQPVGFGRDEALFPYPNRSFLGYRLLQEYFAMPEKFLFFDLTGLHAAARPEFQDQLEIDIFLEQAPSSRAASQRRHLSARVHADRQPV